MGSHVAVQNLAAPVLDHEKAIEHSKRQRRQCEEIECGDHLAMILQKCQPALPRIDTPAHASQLPSHSSFSDDQAEFLQFTMDLRGSPVRVLVRQASDQSPDLLGDLGSTTLRPGTPTPIETET